MPRTKDDLQRELTDLIEQGDRLLSNAAHLKQAADEIRRKSQRTTEGDTPERKRSRPK